MESNDTFSWDQEIMSPEEADRIIEESEQYSEEPTSQDSEEEQMEQVIDSYEEFESEDLVDDQELLNNARLRLEQGRLYEMLIKHDLFQGVDADKRAINNVQREIRGFIKERLEVLLGIKKDPKEEQVQQSNFPFSDLEVDLLKKLLNKISKGATSEYIAPPKEEPKGLNTVKQTEKKQSSLAPMGAPLRSQPQQVKKQSANITVNANKPKKQASSKLSKESAPLTKPPSEMSADELIQRNKEIMERQKKAKVQPKMAPPMPSYEQQEMLYAQQQMKYAATVGPLVNFIQKKLNNNQGE